MNKMKRLTGRKILLVAVAFCAFGFAKAQDTQTEKNTLTLTLDKALEIALDENPTMKVAAEEIALKRVASKEAWQSLLPEASIAGSLDHTIKAAEMKLNDMSFKMGQDGSNTANAGLSINLPLFVPGVYRAMSMTKTDIEQLKVLMGITADVEIKINDNLTNYETTMFANQLKEENVNLNNNTTMKQLDLNMKLLEKNVKSLKTNFMPTLSMSFSYQYQSLYNPNINFFDYNWSNSSSLMFNISIPLYKASNFTKVKSARIQMRQLDWNRIDTERQLNMQIVSCRNNMSASTEQVVSNKENVMQAKKAVVIAEKRYDVGKGTVLELNSSQVSLTQAQLTYNQSIYDYLVAKADLDQVLGKE